MLLTIRILLLQNEKKLNGDSDQAKQLMFNTDGQNIQSNENKNFCPVQQPWHIHLSSWQDPNVVDSLKGQIIQLRLSNPLDTLSSSISSYSVRTFARYEI